MAALMKVTFSSVWNKGALCVEFAAFSPYFNLSLSLDLLCSLIVKSF